MNSLPAGTTPLRRLIALAILRFLVWIWYRPIAHYWNSWAASLREDEISRQKIGILQAFIEQLKGFATPRMDSPAYPLINLGSNPQFVKAPDFNPWISYVNALCSKLLDSLTMGEVNRTNFALAVDTFTILVGLFNDNLFRIVQETLNIAEQTPLPKGVSLDYNTYRHAYIRFPNDYPSFVADVNKPFRTHVLTYEGATRE